MAVQAYNSAYKCSSWATVPTESPPLFSRCSYIERGTLYPYISNVHIHRSACHTNLHRPSQAHSKSYLTFGCDDTAPSYSQGNTTLLHNPHLQLHSLCLQVSLCEQLMSFTAAKTSSQLCCILGTWKVRVVATPTAILPAAWQWQCQPRGSPSPSSSFPCAARSPASTGPAWPA